MRIEEILSELSFQGRKCTKDCGGHTAGYAYAMQKKRVTPCNSTSPSFNDGCEIANDQLKRGKVTPPKVRGDLGKFIQNPSKPKPVITK